MIYEICQLSSVIFSYFLQKVNYQFLQLRLKRTQLLTRGGCFASKLCFGYLARNCYFFPHFVYEALVSDWSLLFIFDEEIAFRSFIPLGVVKWRMWERSWLEHSFLWLPECAGASRYIKEFAIAGVITASFAEQNLPKNSHLECRFHQNKIWTWKEDNIERLTEWRIIWSIFKSYPEFTS